MKLEIDVTQEQHDCIGKGLRDGFTPEEWLQSAWDGKANSCKKRALSSVAAVPDEVPVEVYPKRRAALK